MCNRCDGGNHELEALKCDNCDYVFYQVDNEHKDEILPCPMCKQGLATKVEDGV